MSKVVLSQEQIDAGLRDAKAAVDNGRKAIAELRATRARIGLTQEKVQRFMNGLPPRAQVWINKIVTISVSKIQAQPGAPKTGVRKPRVMI